MPLVSDQVELPTFPTRDNMDSEIRYDPLIRDRTEQEEVDVLLSEGENDKNAEILREYSSSIFCSALACLFVLAELNVRWSLYRASPYLPSCRIPCSFCMFSGQRRNLLRLSASFFLFGLINNGVWSRLCAYQQMCS
jgi:hypothetical protein